MFENDFVTLIAQVGFPIAVAVWFMVKGNQTIQNNTKAINELKNVIIELLKK